ncbi:retinaldehyde-binding protein 1-like isoform X2 [Uranotaenia lowii]|uniref:retinaldehyde-binding protein 1-like isoform X2 n=1 Tax=Uranotaenia lowii TaxID=190385 RepID=UPI002479D8D3|nr:retinaldehyde-binding protein 1-like isoform X2 [Uranotaenia lowii]
MSALSVDKNPEKYDEYSFTLPEMYRKLAEENLGETDEIREHSLAQLRDWIAKHPFIKRCRTDAPFLLRFLRMRKFSVPRAQETLERYLAMRQSFPEWFQKLDPQDSEINEVLDDFQFRYLGQDSKGRAVVSLPIKVFNVDKFGSAHQSRDCQLFLESLADNEQVQIGGYVVLVDYADITMRHIAIWSIVDVKNFINCVNHSLPLRLKEIHAVGLPKFAMTIAELAVSCMSQKLKDRIHCHKSMEDAKKHLEVKMLTTDYEGGTQDPKELKRAYLEQVRAKREELLLLDQMEIDAERYKSLWHLTTDDSIESGVAGSFRKLNVD